MNFNWRLCRRSIASALAAAMLVVACGGGGGDGVVPTPVPTPPVPVTLLAGSLQRRGAMDGTGIEAQFTSPRGLAVDPAGNIYVADSGSITIRKMDPNGVVTTVAGMPYEFGTADGVGSAARFASPSSVAADGAGSVYVADGSGIRKISPGAIVSTLAGSSRQYGAVDGFGPEARFYELTSLAIDSAGNLFVADTGHAVRKVSPDGYVSTFAGKMGEPGFVVADGGQARFTAVSAVAVDAQDRVYVSEGGRLRRFDGTGHALPWGDALQGVVALDSSVCPIRNGMAVAPNGDLIVACSDFAGGRAPRPPDQLRMQVLRVTPAGTVSVVAGHEQGNIDGPAAVARFKAPQGVAVRSDGGILVSDSIPAIRLIDPQGNVSTVAGGTGEGYADGQGSTARFNNPGAVVAAPDGNLYVVDRYNGLVRRVSLNGNVSTLAITRDDGSTFGTVTAIAVATDGTLFVSDWHSGIVAVDSSGRYRVLDRGASASQMAAGPGAVYYAMPDGSGGAGIQKLLIDGTKKIIASGFKVPKGIVVDAAGIVYVADWGDHTVRAIDAQGNVRLVAGKPGEAGYVDGSADQARLAYPSSLAIDDVGNLYFDDNSGTVRKITGDGRVSTVAGTPGSLYFISGMAWRGGMIYATVVNAVIAIGPLN